MYRNGRLAFRSQAKVLQEEMPRQINVQYRKWHPVCCQVIQPSQVESTELFQNYGLSKFIMLILLPRSAPMLRKIMMDRRTNEPVKSSTIKSSAVSCCCWELLQKNLLLIIFLGIERRTRKSSFGFRINQIHDCWWRKNTNEQGRYKSR